MNAPDGNAAALRGHEREQDRLFDVADYREDARESLIERLVAGRTVHALTARDVFDCALNDEAQQPDVFELIQALLALDGRAGADLSLHAHDLVAKARRVIERFVDTKPEWIDERAAELRAEDHAT